MKENKYDDTKLFTAYQKMPRSVKGLEAAGEWHVLKALMPALRHKNVLDLGCGFGWHCRYAGEQQADSVIGVDISENMLKKARESTNDPAISFIKMPIEDVEFDSSQFEVVISSLAFHYIEPFEMMCQKVHGWLKNGGTFLFSVEHPIFTSQNRQEWYYDKQGNILHWPVDQYQEEGSRQTIFLTENVIKYHRTLSTYINSLIGAGFCIKSVKEPVPSDEMLQSMPQMRDELRRPMFLIISAEKKDSS